MASILMWIGISLTIIGWLALAFQASKRLSVKDDSEKFTQKKRAMQLYRNYCLITIIAGVILLLAACII